MKKFLKKCLRICRDVIFLVGSFASALSYNNPALFSSIFHGAGRIIIIVYAITLPIILITFLTELVSDRCDEEVNVYNR